MKLNRTRRAQLMTSLMFDEYWIAKGKTPRGLSYAVYLMNDTDGELPASPLFELYIDGKMIFPWGTIERVIDTINKY